MILTAFPGVSRDNIGRRPWRSQKTSLMSSVSYQARRSDSNPTGHFSSTTSGAAGRPSMGLSLANTSEGGQAILYHSLGLCRVAAVTSLYRLYPHTVYGLSAGPLSPVGKWSPFAVSCVIFGDRLEAGGVGMSTLMSRQLCRKCILLCKRCYDFSILPRPTMMYLVSRWLHHPLPSTRG